MRKLIYLLAIFLISISTSAQKKITDKDLQGNWKLAGYNQNGVTLDVNTGTVTISQEMKNQISPDMMSQIDESVKQILEPLRASKVTFSGNSIEQNMGGQERNGTYSIKDKDGHQIMTTSWSDSTTTETTVWIKDTQLYIFKYEQGQSAEFVFTKA
ncbi:hypothetical protein ACX0HA_05435 [Flavobacterium hauense]